jgi:hypothetical protein
VLERQNKFVIATGRQVILDYVFACSIVKRISKNARNPRLIMESRSADVMRAALPFDSVRCPRCQEQRSDTG